ncbi:SUMF1/EgtB/PvdO family nonheme iron enzyme [Haliscomenobacter sp.]|uniref:formylglycine-generating enzyme family protein n=1 Tax=Haliscomenobacter sp. TaxID=2717303 RepID=UPI00359439AB
MAGTQSRYLGVQPFKTSHRHLFFGRDKDIEDLHDFILLEKLVVLFGKSGYGKSSLLNAGIMPRLMDEKQPPLFRFQPVEVRFTHYAEGQSPAPLETLKRLLRDLPTDPAADFLTDLVEGDTLWLHFKRRQTSTNGQYVLLFDQFEEFFSYPAEQQECLRRQLAELLYTEIPQSVRARLDELSPEARRFLAQPMNIKAVFAIRSDRMSQLDSMKDVLPAILHKRYELRPLTPAQAREAIVKPARIPGEHFASPPFEYTEGGLQAIIRALTTKTAESTETVATGIEAFQLQILCAYLEGLVKDGKVPDLDNNGLPDITAAQLPDMGQLYENYYYRKLDELPAEARSKAQRVLEDALLAEDPATGEGRRKSVDRHDLLQMGLSETLLNELEKTYLIRRELNTVGGFSFEISHDTLVLPIQKAKKVRQALEEQERLQQEQIEKEKQLAEERRKRRRATWLAVAGLVLTAIALVATFFALNQTRMANGNAKVAVDALLNVAQDAVYHLKYEEALPSLLAAAKLGQNKTKVAQALQEIAFVRLESGQKLRETADLISQIGNLLGKSKPTQRNLSIVQMRQMLKGLDANHYDVLMGRYFPVMLSVSKGTFQMGCDSTIDENCQEDEILHTVQLSRFELARTETTFWQWGLYCAANRLALQDYSPNWGIDGDNPAVNVDWFDACAYANWLSSRFGRSAAYKIDSMEKADHYEWAVSLDTTTSNGFRLPTEAEWEYAARGGLKRQPMVYSGSDDLDVVAWYDENSIINGVQRTHPVAGKKNNQLGLYDMSGNVWEWCWDWYEEYNLDMKINPRGPDTGSLRVLRGGSWNVYAEACRVAFRQRDFSELMDNDDCGFRLARTF